MTFNEANVNRDTSGKFDHKIGAPANVSLSVAELDREEYRLAGIRELDSWEDYVASRQGVISRAALEAYPDAERVYMEEVVNEDDGNSYFAPERIEDASGRVLWEGGKELRDELIDHTFWLSEDDFDYDESEGVNAQAMLSVDEHKDKADSTSFEQYQEIRNERLAFDQAKLASAARTQFPTATRVYVENQNNSLVARAIGDEQNVFWTDVDGGNQELSRLSARFDEADPMVKQAEGGGQYIELPIDIMNPHTWSDTPF